MSFSSETKVELMGINAGKKCCRRALACGLLYDAQTDGDRIVVTFSNVEYANYAARIISQCYGSDTVPFSPVRIAPGCYDLALISGGRIPVGALPDDICSCGECLQHYLRGLLIARSSVTDPDKQYHLEIRLENEERAVSLADSLSEIFGRPNFVKRRNGVGLVYKNSSVIEDVFSAAGAMNTYYGFVNGKIEREIRNNANRATNCETRNIASAVAAAQKQSAAIELLISEGELDSLPQELRETAQLRLLYPDMPLSELGAKHCPPVSKSGINHRIKRLIEAADKLKQKIQ